MITRRRIVKLLNDTDNKTGGYTPTREEFVDFIFKNERFYKSFKPWKGNNEELKHEIDNVLGDCMEGQLSYIGYADPQTRTKLKVTTEGRTFISESGFLNELIKNPVIEKHLLPIIVAIIIGICIIIGLVLGISLKGIIEIINAIKTLLIC
jgi:hypothetical protein